MAGREASTWRERITGSRSRPLTRQIEKRRESPARRFLAGAALGFLLAVLVWLASTRGLPLLEEYEERAYDYGLKLTASATPSERLVFLDIDEDSLAWVQNLNPSQPDDPELRWPWPRYFFGDDPDAAGRLKGGLVVHLRETYGARAVVFDVVFDMPDRAGDDQGFAQALERAGRTYLAVMLDKRQGAANDSAQVRAARQWYLEECAVAAAPGGDPLLPGSLLREGVRLHTPILPYPPLHRAAAGLGHVYHAADRDGVSRRAYPLLQVGDRLYPSLALRVAMDEEGVQTVEIDQRRRLRLGDRTIALEPDGGLLVRYRGTLNQVIPRVPIAEVLQELPTVMTALEAGEAPQVPHLDTFRDKIVLVGTSAFSLYDLRPTPMEKAEPGVAIHTAEVEALLDGEYIRILPSFWLLLLLLVTGSGVGAVVASSRYALGATLAGLLLVLAALALEYVAFRYLRVAGHLVAVLTTVVGAYVAAVILLLRKETTRRIAQKRIFQYYMSKPVLDRVLEEGIHLGGERQELTVFFSDISGFTALAEELRPENVVAILNEYFSEMTRAIFEQDGCLDKYIGDGIMALFCPPFLVPDHATRACRAALENLRRLQTVNETLISQGLLLQPLTIRVGINTGQVIVGNLGSREQVTYTVAGDAVNVASRLEGVSKVYRASILAGERTVQLASKMIFFRELDTIRVAGRARPLALYQVLAEMAAATDEMRRATERYRTGLAAYRRRRFAEAELAFRDADGILSGGDPPARVMADRCAALLRDPPPEWWDGAYDMTVK